MYSLCSYHYYLLIYRNAFTYWEGVPIEVAPDTLLEHYRHVQSISNGKLVRISETGWPDQGNQNKESIPTPENQKEYVTKEKKHPFLSLLPFT